MDFIEIPVKKITVDQGQPRKEFDQEGLKQLADSIKEVGQLQPIIVKKQPREGNYLLIAGERRYKAVKNENEDKKIAAVILKQDANIRQVQLIENLQRQDLNPLERAKSIQQFIDENDLTKKAASKKLGVARTTMTEWLNILEVKPVYQQAVLDEDTSLTLSHISLAKALSNRTGDPSKLSGLLDGVMKYNFSRSETKEIVDLFHDYLHMSMEEAFDTILIKRERKKLSQKAKNSSDENDSKTVKKLINSFNKVSDNLEDFMEEVGEVESEQQRENLIDEFLYIYQLLGIMVPEFKEKDLNGLIEDIKKGNLDC